MALAQIASPRHGERETGRPGLPRELRHRQESLYVSAAERLEQCVEDAWRPNRSPGADERTRTADLLITKWRAVLSA